MQIGCDLINLEFLRISGNVSHRLGILQVLSILITWDLLLHIKKYYVHLLGTTCFIKKLIDVISVLFIKVSLSITLNFRNSVHLMLSLNRLTM